MIRAVGLCPKLIPIPICKLMRLVFLGLSQRVHLSEKLRQLMRETADVLVLDLDHRHQAPALNAVLRVLFPQTCQFLA